MLYKIILFDTNSEIYMATQSNCTSKTWNVDHNFGKIWGLCNLIHCRYVNLNGLNLLLLRGVFHVSSFDSEYSDVNHRVVFILE